MQDYILLLIVGLLWGSQFLFIEWSLDTLSAFDISLFRTFVGVLVLSSLIFILKRKEIKITGRLALFYMVIACFEATIPFYLIPLGQKNLDSSVTAILLGLIPLYTVVISYFMYPDNRPGLSKWLGVGIGFTRVLVLFYPFNIELSKSLSMLMVIAGEPALPLL